MLSIPNRLVFITTLIENHPAYTVVAGSVLLMMTIRMALYDGTSTGTSVDAAGVTAQFLMKHGFRCANVEDL